MNSTQRAAKGAKKRRSESAKPSPAVVRPKIATALIKRNRSRSLDEWYKATNYIYAYQNFYRDPLSIFAHLVEVVGGLSQLSSAKHKSGVSPEEYLVKCIAWWFTLCGKLRVRSVAELLWSKFPGVCTYCQLPEHDDPICKEKKKDNPNPIWEQLKAVGTKTQQPSSLGSWQRMFRQIYKPTPKPNFQMTYARLSEELGELSEAVRIFPVNPGYFLSEAADVFAWLMNIQNNIDCRDKKPEEEYGNTLQDAFYKAYPDHCIECSEQRCICAPILKGTIGRIAHELPVSPTFFNVHDIFLIPAASRS